jgi:hypothetical protein
MANNLYTVLIINILLSCQNQKSMNKEITDLTEKKTDTIEDYNPDISIKYFITLMDSKRVDNKIKMASESEYFNDFIFLTNNNGSEYLVLGRSYGAEKETFQSCDLISIKEQKILDIKEYNSRPFKKKLMESGVQNFRTDSNIKLGMSKENVLKIKGNKFKTSLLPTGEKVITYIIDNPNSKILSSNNMPVYLAEFYFKNDKLYRYWFGFPNP